jgi:HEPN domain-containing protein
MMTKEQHIEYWIKSAESDMEAIEALFEADKFIHALFFAHLVLEKWCKAHFVKDNESNIPPKTHNLVRLTQLTNLDLEEEQLLFLEEFNDFQLEGRYPDYLFEINRRCDKIYTTQLLEQVKLILQCLQEKM